MSRIGAGGRRHRGAAAAVALAVLLLPAARASAGGVPPLPIPQNPADVAAVPAFTGSPATAAQVSAPLVPQHPFMAANGRSNLHDDAYMSNTYVGSGPLGSAIGVLSTFQSAECASLTFDRAGRIVGICVGLEGPRLVMFDAHTLALLAVMPLPPRSGTTNPLSDFAGGGYFYLDQSDRAVIPTNNDQIWVVAESSGPAFSLRRAYDVSSVMAPGDQIISALPDWSGRIWFATTRGVVGTVDPNTGGVKALNLREPIGNSFSVDETGGVFIVTDAAMYRFDAAPDGSPSVSWREVYANTGIRKPGQTEFGSGTTPTLMGTDYVAITDNADPMDVVVYRRATAPSASRVVCTVPVFSRGASATDNSLIGTDRSMIVENNYGYSGPAATIRGASTAPGIERVDINRQGMGCTTVWSSNERAPSAVPKLSLANGLVYLYTKPPRSDGVDAWYLTALSLGSGQTVWSRLAGTGLGFNSNYAPISIGPDGIAYVGVLGGLVLLRDGP